MQADFKSVEAELREIECDFASGRMNAFGSAQGQDAFLRELKRIAEIETQVFYKTCSILKSGNTADHALLTNVFASAQPPPQARTTAGASTTAGRSPGSRVVSPSKAGSSARAGSLGASFDSSGGLGESSAGKLSRGYGSAASGVFASGVFTAVESGSANSTANDGTGAAPHIRSAEWSNETGFPDRVFEDVAERFRSLEADFSVLGNQLRQVSQHVMQLNAMSEEDNKARNNSNNASGNGNDEDAMAATNAGPLDSMGSGGVVGSPVESVPDDTGSVFGKTVYWR